MTRQMTAKPALRYNHVRSGVAMNTNDKAPEFTLPDENGQDVSLKDFRGKNVVLFFFPKADTPG
jgi:peroxiredoxin Q/BCP